MRKLLVSIAAAGTLMAVASPAAAQWHRPNYNRGYGYNVDNGTRVQLERDVQGLVYSRDNLARSGRLTGAEARNIDQDINWLQRSINVASRGGISRGQVPELQNRIYRVRQELRRYSDYDGNRGRYRTNRYGRRY
jgi:hypothetical protein